MGDLPCEIFEFDRYRLDVAKRLLTEDDGQAIALTPKVFNTLVQLVRSGGHVLTKDQLLREVWANSVVEENNLNQHISTLRRIFGERPGEHRFIVTVAGHGYRFVPEVKHISEVADDATPI